MKGGRTFDAGGDSKRGICREDLIPRSADVASEQ